MLYFYNNDTNATCFAFKQLHPKHYLKETSSNLLWVSFPVFRSGRRKDDEEGQKKGEREIKSG